MEWKRSEAWLERARRVIPGGVNSNVRMLALPHPLFFERGEGPRITDVDGNTYIDYVLGQGPLIHGHGHPELLRAAAEGMQRGTMFAGQHETEVLLAERIAGMVPGAERVRFGSSGSEMVQAALRIARAATGRPKIVKFEGHYHGWFDSVLVSVAPPAEDASRLRSPGSDVALAGVPGSRGQSEAALSETIVLPWNDEAASEAVLRAHAREIAAVITEPIMANVGCILPRPGYLEKLRALCTELGIVLIFDEVITGFRVAPGGAQEYLGVRADLCVFGKAMAGGFPIACLAGRSDLMELLATGGVNHSGTYNANVPVTAASLACLDLLSRDGGAAYRDLFALGQRLRDGIAAAARARGLPVQVQGPGPMFHVAFASEPLHDARSVARADAARYHRLAIALLERGVRVLERGLWYVSTAHTEGEIEATLDAVESALDALPA